MRINPDVTKPAQTRSVLLLAVPNVLTLTRLALGIAFPLIPDSWRLGTLLAAATTEFLDGQLARLLRASGATGRILDPIADKVLVASVLVTLLAEGTVKPWQLIPVLLRDIVVAAGALWVAGSRGIYALRGMPPSLLGKLATAAQFLFLLTIVATGEVNLVLLIATSILSATAAVDYAMRVR